jgi:hypothetical protein
MMSLALGVRRQTMFYQRDKSPKLDPFQTGLPPAAAGEDVPRWLVVLGLAAGFTLFVALLRYAVDLLGVVFVIIVVGFAIRAVSDWLTEGESVSGWALSALSMGLMGTGLVGLWLFNSSVSTLESRLPGPVRGTVAWLEARGWGQRVLLPGDGPRSALAGTGSSPFGGAPSGASASGRPEREAPSMLPRMTPRAPAPAAASSSAPRSERRRSLPARPPVTGEAEAAPRAVAPPVATPAPVRTARVPTSVTLTASPTRVVVGRAVRLTATVQADEAASAPPSGAVTFFIDGAVLGQAPVRRGTAVLVTLDAEIGDHTLTAAYGGDARHLEERSSPVSVTVTRR